MQKRMTLLAKKDGMSVSDFRSYWAGPHAKLALGMDGIAKYAHNRVEKLLWTATEAPPFNVDGVVELYFTSDAAMRNAQASAVGSKFIPEDEPNFLKGWTLCVVDTEGVESFKPTAKVVVPFLLRAGNDRERMRRALVDAAAASSAGMAINWTASTARRERLWSEPNPPDGFAVLWFDAVADAHMGFDGGSPLRKAIESEFGPAAAYLVDELTIR